jgi:hypothetical protein
MFTNTVIVPDAPGTCEYTTTYVDDDYVSRCKNKTSDEKFCVEHKCENKGCHARKASNRSCFVHGVNPLDYTGPLHYKSSFCRKHQQVNVCSKKCKKKKELGCDCCKEHSCGFEGCVKRQDPIARFEKIAYIGSFIITAKESVQDKAYNPVHGISLCTFHIRLLKIRRRFYCDQIKQLEMTTANGDANGDAKAVEETKNV